MENSLDDTENSATIRGSGTIVIGATTGSYRHGKWAKRTYSAVIVLDWCGPTYEISKKHGVD